MINILIRQYSYWSEHPTAKAVCSFFIFTIIVIVTGVLIIYFTSKKPSK